MKQAFGWICLGIGVLIVGGTVDDVVGGVAQHIFSNLTVAALFGAGGAALVRSAKHDDKRRLASRAQGQLVLPQGLPVEALVLRTARAQKGRVTPTEVAAATAMPFAEAKQELERLAESGACQVVVGEGGLVVYRFPEFEDETAKREAM